MPARLPARQTGGQDGQGRRSLKIFALLATIAVAIVTAAVIGFVLLAPSATSPPRAAILDQLSLTFPNPSFREQATALLQQAGYEVDYFPGEEVTVDFLHNVAGQRYKYLIWRVHSTAELRDPSGAISTNEMFLFTGEPYSQAKYADEQRAGDVVRTHYSVDDPRLYFGIAPAFIKSRMKGSFDGATVILMGCEGLKSDTAAKAFVDKGAKAVIGWDGSVSGDHTDAATERLLQHLVVDKLGTQEAVTRTMSEMGPDPSSGSKLHLYPAETASAGP